MLIIIIVIITIAIQATFWPTSSIRADLINGGNTNQRHNAVRTISNGLAVSTTPARKLQTVRSKATSHGDMELNGRWKFELVGIIMPYRACFGY